MLLDGHQLHGVVAQLLNPGQHQIRELPVGADPLFLGCHADMRLIDQRRLRLFLLPFPVGPGKGFRIPDLAAEHMGPEILLRPGDAGGDAFEPAPVLFNPQLDVLAVLQRVPSLEQDFPDAVLLLLHRMQVVAPSVEIARQIRRVRAGQPFPDNPSRLRPVNAEIQVSVREIRQGFRVPHQLGSSLQKTVHPQVDFPAVGLQPGIDANDFIGTFQFPDIHSAASFCPPARSRILLDFRNCLSVPSPRRRARCGACSSPVYSCRSRFPLVS